MKCLQMDCFCCWTIGNRLKRPKDKPLFKVVVGPHNPKHKLPCEVFPFFVVDLVFSLFFFNNQSYHLKINWWDEMITLPWVCGVPSTLARLIWNGKHPDCRLVRGKDSRLNEVSYQPALFPSPKYNHLSTVPLLTYTAHSATTTTWDTPWFFFNAIALKLHPQTPHISAHYRPLIFHFHRYSWIFRLLSLSSISPLGELNNTTFLTLHGLCDTNSPIQPWLQPIKPVALTVAGETERVAGLWDRNCDFHR